MSARDDLIAGLLGGAQHWMAAGEDPVEAGHLADAYRDQVATETQKTDAALIRKAKVREPIDDAEEYLNAVLEDVAVKIEGGPDA